MCIKQFWQVAFPMNFVLKGLDFQRGMEPSLLMLSRSFLQHIYTLCSASALYKREQGSCSPLSLEGKA